MERENKKIKKPSQSWDNLKKLWRNFIFFSKLAYKCSPYAFPSFLILSIISSFFPAITSKVFGNLIDSLTSFIKSGDASNVWRVLILYAGVVIIPNIIDIFNDLSSTLFQSKFIKFIDLYLSEKRGSLDIAHIEDPKFQDLMQQAFSMGTIGPVSDLINMGINTAGKFLVVIISSVVLLTVDWRIFALVVVLSLPKLFYEIKFGGIGWSLNAATSGDQRIAQTLRNFFTNKFSVIESKLFQIQTLFLNKISKINEDYNLKKSLIEKERAKYGIISELLSTTGMFLGLTLAISEALKGNITVGAVVFLFSIISTFNNNISGFLINTARLLERNLYVTDIATVINTKSVIKELKNPKKITSDITPEIEFKNVSFKYPGQDNYVLKNISFKILPGEKWDWSDTMEQEKLQL